MQLKCDGFKIRLIIPSYLACLRVGWVWSEVPSRTDDDSFPDSNPTMHIAVIELHIALSFAVNSGHLVIRLNDYCMGRFLSMHLKSYFCTLSCARRCIWFINVFFEKVEVFRVDDRFRSAQLLSNWIASSLSVCRRLVCYCWCCSSQLRSSFRTVRWPFDQSFPILRISHRMQFISADSARWIMGVFSWVSVFVIFHCICFSTDFWWKVG